MKKVVLGLAFVVVSAVSFVANANHIADFIAAKYCDVPANNR